MLDAGERIRLEKPRPVCGADDLSVPAPPKERRVDRVSAGVLEGIASGIDSLGTSALGLDALRASPSSNVFLAAAPQVSTLGLSLVNSLSDAVGPKLKDLEFLSPHSAQGLESSPDGEEGG